MLVEICANSFESASNAEQAGADRIELCSELALGGVTPSHGLIQKVVEELSIKVNVLVRPRSGDFTYSEHEFEVMKRDIQFCKEIGCNGIVSGILNKDHTIDIKRTKQLVEIAKPLSFTFHRAFDWTINPQQALEQLAAIGVETLLTSGQATSALNGIELLAELKDLTTSNLTIMPGAGVNKNNIEQFKNKGFTAIHFSATNLHKTIDTPKIAMNSQRFFDETCIAISDIGKIKQLIAFVK